PPAVAEAPLPAGVDVARRPDPQLAPWAHERHPTVVRPGPESANGRLTGAWPVRIVPDGAPGAAIRDGPPCVARCDGPRGRRLLRRTVAPPSAPRPSRAAAVERGH